MKKANGKDEDEEAEDERDWSLSDLLCGGYGLDLDPSEMPKSKVYGHMIEKMRRDVKKGLAPIVREEIGSKFAPCSDPAEM